MCPSEAWPLSFIPQDVSFLRIVIVTWQFDGSSGHLRIDPLNIDIIQDVSFLNLETFDILHFDIVNYGILDIQQI